MFRKQGTAPLWTAPLLIVSATLFLGAMVPNLFVLAPRYLGDLGYDEGEIGGAMGAFNLCSLVVFPFVGLATARFGHARVLAAGCALCSLGGVLFAGSEHLVGFAAARAIQGTGFAAVMVGAGAYVAERAPLARMGEALGIAGVLTLTAQAVGPVVGEALLPLGWPVVFATAVVCGVLGGLVALALPPARRDTADVITPASSAWTILIAFGLAGVGFGAIWTFLADYTRQVGIAHTTWLFVPYVIAAVSTRLFLGSLADRVGRREAATPMLVGHAVILLVMVVLSAPWQLVLVGLVYGLCHGVYYPTLQAMIVERSGGRRGRAVASSTFAFGAGIVLSAYVLGPVARAAGYPMIYGIASAAGLVSAVLVARTPALVHAPREEERR